MHGQYEDVCPLVMYIIMCHMTQHFIKQMNDMYQHLEALKKAE
jgi:hypothetical protein